ncbi:hypothetical protein NH340_JMT07877 [Sarcoptes scabiei]|nr:hypothetical protein NH340_JMT07877 [Sarcoptes scabiei]
MSKRNRYNFRSHSMNSINSSISNRLKFSTASMTSARSRNHRSELEQNNPTTSDGDQQQNWKRRKFFNASTGLMHVVSLMFMRLCRQITNRSSLSKRLIGYFLLIFLGGLMKDFAPSLTHPSLFALSRENCFNRYLVKIAWFWNMIILVPIVALSSSTLSAINKINLDQIEQSIEIFFQQQTTNQSKKYMVPISQELEKTEESLENFPPFTLKWFRCTLLSAIKLIFVKDIFRLIICTSLYYCSKSIFETIRSMTANVNSSKLIRSSGYVNNFDTSGHVYILVFSNLILIEECVIMIGWEPLGDRLYSLSQECKNIIANYRLDIDQIEIRNETINRYDQKLMKIWHNYHRRTSKLRFLFILATIITLIWDFMLIQTALYYHNLVEKFFALIWAYLGWFLTYRCIFPSINLSVRIKQLGLNQL